MKQSLFTQFIFLGATLLNGLNKTECIKVCETNTFCNGIVFNESLNESRCQQGVQLLETNGFGITGEGYYKDKIGYYTQKCVNGYSRKACNSIKKCKWNKGRRGVNQYGKSYCGTINHLQ